MAGMRLVLFFWNFARWLKFKKHFCCYNLKLKLSSEFARILRLSGSRSMQ